MKDRLTGATLPLLLPLCVRLTYDADMDTETKAARWTIRVSPADDMLVRRVVAESRMSLSEYVVSQAVAAAYADLADRRLFSLAPEEWTELQDVLDRPAAAKPRLIALLEQPSVLETE